MEKSEKSSPEPSVCLKCGSQISHIPYRYNGQVFHARCLLCNACGKRLIGKPFITINRQIFCGDKCQESFLKGKSPKPPSDPPHPEPSVSEGELPTVSIEDVRLDKTSTGNMPGSSSPSMHSYRSSSSRSDYQHLQPPHPSYPPPPPPSRLTDYPVASSSPLVTRSYTSNDSLSTLSESSFTSDSSSYTYEPHRKPKKKILKNSNAPRKRHKNRVRWDLNNLHQYQPHHERQYSDETDTLSLESSTSSFSGYLPSTTHMYPPPPRENAPQGWRDYEQRVSPSNSMPGYSRGLSQSQTSLNPAYGQCRSLYRSYSGDIPSPTHSSSDTWRRYDSAQTLHSHSHLMPVSYHGYPAHGPPPPPVFYPDESNLPDFDEERRRRHLYKIPPRLSGSGSILQTLSEDDKSDYDHLSTPPPPPPQRTVQERLSPSTPDSQWYTSEDIEEALQLINESGTQSDEEDNKTTPSKLSPQIPTKAKDSPPPPPPKRVSSLPATPHDVNHIDATLPAPIVSATSVNSDPSLSLPSSPPGPPRQDSIILSPPPEFASEDTKPRYSIASESVSLSSPSMETLKSYPYSDSPSSLDDGLTPEVHPEIMAPPQSSLKELGASWGSPLKMKDRIVEGAEDPHRTISPPLSQPLPSSSNITETKSSSGSYKPSVSDYAASSIAYQISTVQQQMSNLLSPDSVDTSNDSPSMRRVRTSPHGLSSSIANRSPTIGGSASNLSPPYGGVPVKLTKEEEATVQWLKQSRNMKPVKVDTDREIEQMMAGLGKSGKHRYTSRSASNPSLSSATRQKYFGTCTVCQKAIENSQSLFSFASRMYHTKCFCCAQCGCPLRGKQIYTVKGLLVCSDDYSKMTSSPSTHHSLPAVALMKDTRDPVLFQRIIQHSPSTVSRTDHLTDHMINGEINNVHNSATMV